MYIKVKVTSGARKETLEKVSADVWNISVKQKAERNMANNRIKEIIATELQIPINRVRLISGHTSPSKIFSIYDL